MQQFLKFRGKVTLTFLVAVGVVVSFFATIASHEAPIAAAQVQISNQQFAAYVTRWSEPEGYFDSDNFISNETSYQHVVPDLKARSLAGGVYIGVGPDQNFTYIAHTRPALAIIVDIRRQNMLEHLLFKALFEQASSRADYLALLFAKEKPKIQATAGLPDILAAVRQATSSEALFAQHLSAVRTLLVDKYGLSLTSEDLRKIEYVYRTFWMENLDLRFSSIGRGNRMQYPTFEDLLLETDRDGHLQNFLATDALFQWLKTFQHENRLIPIVGDFGGRHAFTEISQYLKAQGLQLSTFYTSNVEYYLFGDPSWAGFMRNVHSLPVSAKSVFVRAYFGNYGRLHPLNVRGHRSTSMVHEMVPFISDYDAGKIPSYWEVVHRNR